MLILKNQFLIFRLIFLLLVSLPTRTDCLSPPDLLPSNKLSICFLSIRSHNKCNYSELIKKCLASLILIGLIWNGAKKLNLNPSPIHLSHPEVNSIVVNHHLIDHQHLREQVARLTRWKKAGKFELKNSVKKSSEIFTNKCCCLSLDFHYATNKVTLIYRVISNKG